MKLRCQCGKKLGVPSSLLGRHIQCPFCGTTILVERQEELPLALDGEPSPEELLIHKSAAEDETPESDAAEALSELAAVVGEQAPELPLARSANEQPKAAPEAAAGPSAAAPGRPAGAPVPQGPPEPSRAVPGAATAEPQDLIMALEVAAAPASTRPTRATQSSPGARPRPSAPRRPSRNGAAPAGTDETDEDEGPPRRKRDLLPLILSGAAALMFIGLIVGFIYAVTHRPAQIADNTPRPVVVTSPIKSAPANTESTDSPAGYEFFGHVRPRTSAEYEKEQQKKQDKQ